MPFINWPYFVQFFLFSCFPILDLLGQFLVYRERLIGEKVVNLVLWLVEFLVQRSEDINRSSNGYANISF